MQNYNSGKVSSVSVSKPMRISILSWIKSSRGLILFLIKIIFIYAIAVLKGLSFLKPF